jgi:hypothetical protein
VPVDQTDTLDGGIGPGGHRATWGRDAPGIGLRLRKSIAGYGRRNQSRSRDCRAKRTPATVTTKIVITATGHIGRCPLIQTGMTTANTTAPRINL